MGSGVPTSGAGRPTSRRGTETAGEGLQTAKELRERANKAADQGNHGTAFELTTRAWEHVRGFPADPQCRSLTTELERDLEALAEQANAQTSTGSALRRKRLVDK